VSKPAAEKVADALLYEGYMLYPYRPSAVKNRQRFNFGVIYPEGSDAAATEGADSHLMRTECLAEGDEHSWLSVKLRFLQLAQRREDRLLQPWQEAVERSVFVGRIPLGKLAESPRRIPFKFAASDTLEQVRDEGGSVVGEITRHQCTIDAELELSAAELAPKVFRICAEIRNVSTLDPAYGPSRDDLLLHSLVSAHTILSLSGGAFVSLLDPPAEHRILAATCRGIRTWPVLVGAEGQRDTMLSSPIIIYDYPAIAPESPGDLFDGTEIDEILSLRILTMTDEEKSEMRQSDDRARRLLERTESLDADQFMQMHGTMREIRPDGAVTR
jgi:hypothetical protein